MSDWAEAHQLTEIQSQIFDYLLTHSWSETMEEFAFRSKETLSRCIIRTALGYRWDTDNTNSGKTPYLSLLYEERLVGLCDQQSKAHNCLTTADVADLARLARSEMYSTARSALLARHCPRLAAKLVDDGEEPSGKWISRFVERYELHLVNAQTMEAARRMACDRSRIREYFLRWLPLFNRDPRLIFGADETDIKPNMRTKVVAAEGQQGHVEGTAFQHMTAMCCHSAGGTAVPPLIVLPGLKKMPKELAGPALAGPNQAWYCSTVNGWMTEGTFYCWVLLFCAWSSQYRATVLPQNLKAENILLVIDGHTSRRCPWAIPMLMFHNITVLILPAHTTHLLQAFDVGLAAALKAQFNRFLAIEKRAHEDEAQKLSTAAWVRKVVVSAFLRAWASVTSGPLCARSFEKVGIWPPNPEVVLASPFVVDSPNPTLEEKNWLNNAILTTDEARQRLLQEKPERDTPDAPIPDFSAATQGRWPTHGRVVTWMMQQDVKWGRLLSDPLDIFYLVGNCYQLVESFQRRTNLIETTASIANMMARLTALEHDRAEEHLNAVINAGVEESNRELQQEVIRASARELAESIAQDLVTERVRNLGEMLASEVRERLREFVEEARAGETTATDDVILSWVEVLAERTEMVLAHWLESGREPSEEEVDRILVEEDPATVEENESGSEGDI